MIPHSIPDKVYSIEFDITNENVVYSTGRAIIKYNINERTFKVLV